LAKQQERLWDEALAIEVRALPEDLAVLDRLLDDPAVLGPIVERFRREVIEERRALLTDGRAKTGQERDAVPELAAAHPGSVMFCDGGFCGREDPNSMELIDIQLITPIKHKPSQRPATETAKARIRLVIESEFATLKRQMGLEAHLAKTLPGLVARIA
jgi:hypothetical protein